ncbi:MAG: SBBP repeat-containing protein [Bacteroidia bacterium]
MKKLILFCLLFFAKQIIAQSGIITTVAGGFGLGNSTNLSVISSAMTIDNAGNIYFVDGTQFNSIRKLSPSGILSTYAGGGFDFNGDGGQSTNAYFHTPAGITMDVLGNLYIADQYHNTIRKVDVSGILSTIAGNGTGGFSGDGGQATNAELDQPATIAIDALGNVCFSDNNNQRVRKIDASGIISTIAGSGLTGFGGDGGQATQAKLTYPSGIAFDPSGNLYIGESVDYRIRKVATSGIITTIAGNGINGYSGDGGQATLAEINYPQFLTIDALGNIYFAGSNVIREINTSSGIITTVAGNGTHGFSGDGGQATNAELFAYAAINDASGNLYISDNTRIRKVDATGIITTIAGNGWFDYGGDGDQATSAQIHYSNGVVLDSLGNLYISDNKHIRKVDISGVITTLAGNGSTNFSGDGGLATNAGLNKPCGMAIDSNNNLYIAETGHNCIRKITAGV